MFGLEEEQAQVFGLLQRTGTVLESVWQYEAACVGVPSVCLLGAVVPQRAAWGNCSTARGGRGQRFHAWPFVSLLREYDEHILAVPFYYMSTCDTLPRCS